MRMLLALVLCALATRAFASDGREEEPLPRFELDADEVLSVLGPPSAHLGAEGGADWDPGSLDGSSSGRAFDGVGARNAQLPVDDYGFPSEPAFGQRGTALGGDMEIWAYPGVDPAAIARAAHLLDRMLAFTPQHVRRRMRANRPRVVIMGRSQLATDMPGLRRFRKEAYDEEHGFNWAEVRGVVMWPPYPLAAWVGEEDVMETYDALQDFSVQRPSYPGQSVFVHEVAHVVMNWGFSACEVALVKRRFEEGMAAGAYTNGTYMTRNSREWWACLTQAYFEAAVFNSLVDGLFDLAAVQRRHPDAAELLEMAYGGNPWRFPHDCLTCNAVWPWWNAANTTRRNVTVPYRGNNSCPVIVPASCSDGYAGCPYEAVYDNGCTNTTSWPPAFCAESCRTSSTCRYSPPPPLCVDRDPTCSQRAAAGECWSAASAGVMRSRCYKSCFCGGGANCTDTRDTCLSWSQSGYCTHPEWAALMGYTCPPRPPVPAAAALAASAAAAPPSALRVDHDSVALPAAAPSPASAVALAASAAVAAATALAALAAS
ncbi:hypothetical protein HYH03_018565 [Edaphochlamys debaryana]|uniref:ShKT domain-containing protein n=1 Tax=Edaphochlamys debaryana TaxID=47281 RepID=A0A835XFT0_9CHLO|nr:hypothetical protein HYH03_018565 [Edaphochlamys debaryana]|eukprot:KAG2482520.1 hypothetical protein HYH03_018565 [Edaphochlamys debaryana]